MNDILPIIEQLERIEEKLDGRYSNKFLSINQVADHTSLSASTIRRAIKKGELKANKKGKWLIKASWLENYLSS